VITKGFIGGKLLSSWALIELLLTAFDSGKQGLIGISENPLSGHRKKMIK